MATSLDPSARLVCMFVCLCKCLWTACFYLYLGRPSHATRDLRGSDLCLPEIWSVSTTLTYLSVPSLCLLWSSLWSTVSYTYTLDYKLEVLLTPASLTPAFSVRENSLFVSSPQLNPIIQPWQVTVLSHPGICPAELLHEVCESRNAQYCGKRLLFFSCDRLSFLKMSRAISCPRTFLEPEPIQEVAESGLPSSHPAATFHLPPLNCACLLHNNR